MHYKFASHRIRQIFDCLLVFLSALLTHAAFPGGGYPWVGWFALVQLGVALHGKTAREGFSLTLAWAFVSWLAAIWWVVPGVASVSGTDFRLITPIALFSCLVFALPYGIAGMVSSYNGWLNTLGGALKAACVWTAICNIVPQLLPGNLAHSQYLYPHVIQILDLGGVPLLFFFLHFVNWLLVAALLTFSKNRLKALQLTGVASLTVLLIIGYGHLRLQGVQKASVKPETVQLKVGMVQPNVPVSMRTRHNREDIMHVLNTLSLGLQKAQPQLIIWPEIPMPFSVKEYPNDKVLISRLREKTDAAILNAGAFHERSATKTERENRLYNVMEFTKEGEETSLYRKQRLIPFGEYIPGERFFPFLRKIFPSLPAYSSGKKTGLFDLDSHTRIIPLLCYEAIFPDLVAAGVSQGGNIIVNPVNDAWFGESPGPEIHFAVAMFRSVEFRIPLIRVTNSGISAVVAASGEIGNPLSMELFKRNSAVRVVSLPKLKSLYALWGDAFLWFFIGVTLLLLLGARFCKGTCQSMVRP